MLHLVLVAVGGAIGASLRHLANLASLRLLGPNFPWGTMAINIAGGWRTMGLTAGARMSGKAFPPSIQAAIAVTRGML